MNFKEIKEAAEKMTFEAAVRFITSLNLQLSLIRDMSTEKLWRVENPKEIGYISISYKSLITGMAQVGLIPNK